MTSSTPNLINQVFATQPPSPQEFLFEKPYPHVCLDDFLTPTGFQSVRSAFESHLPLLERDMSHDLLVCRVIDPKLLQLFLGMEFIRFMQRVFKVRMTFNVEHSPEFRRSVMPMGGLVAHTDFNPTGPRSFSLLYYCSADWQPSSGGELVLGETEESIQIAPGKVIEPIPNRFVGFEITPDSWHGVRPLTRNVHRDSISLYFVATSDNTR